MSLNDAAGRQALREVRELTLRVEALELILKSVGAVFRPEDSLDEPRPEDATVVTITDRKDDDSEHDGTAERERKELERAGFIEAPDDTF